MLISNEELNHNVETLNKLNTKKLKIDPLAKSKNIKQLPRC